MITGLLHDGIFASGDWTPHLDVVQDLVAQEGIRVLKQVVPLEAVPPSTGLPSSSMAV